MNNSRPGGTVVCCAAEENEKAHDVLDLQSHTPQQEWTQHIQLAWSNYCIHLGKNVKIVSHAHQLKKQKNKHKKIGHKLYMGDHYLPSVSPLLSSGFVPGLFS